MKITVYNYRDFDEGKYFEKYKLELGVDLVICRDAPNMENAALAEGSECINIITSKMTRELIERFAKLGVKYIATRTIGYDHIDMAGCREFGIRVSNAPYGPEGVADYTVMMILMAIRNMKRILERGGIQDYTLAGLNGRELHDLTVGVVGTGRIGRTVMQYLSGFSCRVLAYDLHQQEEAKKYGEYVSLEQIWRESDVITLHMPLTEENYHMVNSETIQKMKDGVVLINTARGPLIHAEALIAGLEQGKIGAAALDVVENEFGLYYYDHKSDVLENRELAVLKSFPNVTVSHHMAFYTENAIRTMVQDSLMSCKRFMTGEENAWEVN